MVVIIIGCNKDLKNRQTGTTEKAPAVADLSSEITVNDTLIVDLENSNIYWIGRKVTGEHSGTLNLSDGFVIWNGKSITGGKITVDMTSIKNTIIRNKTDADLELPLDSILSTKGSRRYEMAKAMKKGATTLREK